MPTLEALTRDLVDRDQRVRERAVQGSVWVIERALEQPADHPENLRTQVISALIAHLSPTDEPAESVRGATCNALADVQATEAVEALIAAVDDPALFVRQLAISALGDIRDVRARDRVRKALADSQPEIRFQAVLALPRLLLSDPVDIDGAYRVLSLALEDDDPEVRERAAETCAEISAGNELPPTLGDRLAKLASRETETPAVRVNAAIALAESHDARASSVLLAVIQGKMPEPVSSRFDVALELACELGIPGAKLIARDLAFGLKARLGDPSRRNVAMLGLLRLGDSQAEAFVLQELGASRYERKVAAIGLAGRAGLQSARAQLSALTKDSLYAEAAGDALERLDNARPTAEV